MVLAIHFHSKDLFDNLLFNRAANVGAYGVQLFFVLSGFLITGILLKTRGEPGGLRKFYARRILRIFPLYYGALFAVFVVLPLFVTLDPGAKDIATKQGWLWAHLANWPAFRELWDRSSLFHLGHFWSLAVEEHFYLVWPALVMVLSNRGIVRLCIVLVAVGVTTRFLFATGHEWAAWSTFRKVDGLAVGSLLSVVIRGGYWLPSGRVMRWLTAILGTLSIAYLARPRRLNQYPPLEAIGETLIVCLFAIAVLAAVRGSCSQLLTAPWLMAFGRYSYGLYVIHGILRPALERLMPFPYGLQWQVLYYLLATGICFALAALSFHTFEAFFLRLKRFFDYGEKPGGAYASQFKQSINTTTQRKPARM